LDFKKYLRLRIISTATSLVSLASILARYSSLASTSTEQARRAICHMFQEPAGARQYPFPYGICTIPEISMIGKTERELTEAKIPHEVGVARYDDVAKGQMAGDGTGMLKIPFHPDSLKVLGVHTIGESATEIIDIGQTVLILGGTIEFFRDSVFNYPTLAEAYKIAALNAALNGLNKVRGRISVVKRCPTCNRVYDDVDLVYRSDGAVLFSLPPRHPIRWKRRCSPILPGPSKCWLERTTPGQGSL
jgi:hypothetical protein